MREWSTYVREVAMLAAFRHFVERESGSRFLFTEIEVWASACPQILSEGAIVRAVEVMRAYGIGGAE